MFSPPPSGAVELETLMPVNGVVSGAMENHEGRRDIAHMENRRLVLIKVLRGPRSDAFAHAHLADFHDALLEGAGAGVRLVVEADQIGGRSPGNDRGKHLRAREDVGALVASPAVTLQSNVLRIGVTEIDHLLY